MNKHAELCIVVCCRRMLDNKQGSDSDGEDGADFVPSMKELQSSSDDEEEGEEEAENSDEEVVEVKKRKRATAGSRTPRSTKKTRSLTRTPCKTPTKKVQSSWLIVV